MKNLAQTHRWQNTCAVFEFNVSQCQTNQAQQRALVTGSSKFASKDNKHQMLVKASHGTVSNWFFRWTRDVLVRFQTSRCSCGAMTGMEPNITKDICQQYAKAKTKPTTSELMAAAWWRSGARNRNRKKREKLRYRPV